MALNFWYSCLPPERWGYKWAPPQPVYEKVGMEPRVLHMLGKHSIHWDTPSPHFLCCVFRVPGFTLAFIQGLAIQSRLCMYVCMYFVCVMGEGYPCALVPLWLSENNLQGSNLSFHDVDPEAWIQVLRLGDKSLYLLSPLAGPRCYFYLVRWVRCFPLENVWVLGNIIMSQHLPDCIYKGWIICAIFSCLLPLKKKRIRDWNELGNGTVSDVTKCAGWHSCHSSSQREKVSWWFSLISSISEWERSLLPAGPSPSPTHTHTDSV